MCTAGQVFLDDDVFFLSLFLYSAVFVFHKLSLDRSASDRVKTAVHLSTKVPLFTRSKFQMDEYEMEKDECVRSDVMHNSLSSFPCRPYTRTIFLVQKLA